MPTSAQSMIPVISLVAGLARIFLSLKSPCVGTNGYSPEKRVVRLSLTWVMAFWKREGRLRLR